MRSPELAEQAALTFLSNGPFGDANPELVALKAQEFDEGWIFPYQSAKFLQTGDFNDMFVGNPPVFVPRNGAPACFISYHRPIGESLAAFRYSGNTDALANAQIRIFGYKKGALVISAIGKIREHSSLGLGAVKKIVDNCLDGIPSFVNTSSIASAHDLVSELLRVGFIAEITYGN